MPNWCENTLTITGNEEQKKDFFSKVIKVINNEQVFDLSALFPYPEGLEQNWYDWEINNWGTKWGNCEIFSFEEDCVKFDSAWSPPIKWIENISNQYPELDFRLSYIEPGMCFCGVFEGNFKDGFYDVEGEIVYTDEDDKVVVYDSNKSMYKYVETNEYLGEDFCPNCQNSLEL